MLEFVEQLDHRLTEHPYRDMAELAKSMGDRVIRIIDDDEDVGGNSEPASSGKDNVVERLRKLEALRSENLISTEEYEIKRSKILEDI